MLGKNHIAITSATIFPFLIPFLFQTKIDVTLPIIFFISAFIGSILPDADCKGKSKLFYQFQIIDDLMKKVIIKSVVFFFEKIVKKKYNLSYEVKEEHRGIMHSPIGIFISSFLLTFFIFIFTILVNLFNPLILLLIFLGVLFGQFMHLIEDSCTVYGINWKFPFGTKELKGKIFTFQKEENKRDIRPLIFEMLLSLVSIILLLVYALKGITFSLLIYPIILLIVVIIWFGIILLSKSEMKFWYQDIETLNKVKKQFNNLGKKYSYN